MSQEIGVPAGCVGRLPRDHEFDTIEQYSMAIVEALETQSRQRDKVLEYIDSVDYEKTSANNFWTKYARRGVPVVLAGAAQAMAYDMSEWCALTLATRFPDYPISLRVGGERNGSYDVVETKETTLFKYCMEKRERETDGVVEGEDVGENEDVMYGANNFVHPELISKIILPDLGFPKHVSCRRRS